VVGSDGQRVQTPHGSARMAVLPYAVTTRSPQHPRSASRSDSCATTTKK
jgi:hypothetical protein